ncbi:MAG TPA: PIN domain-containing protein, partial [Sphingomonas sp.]|nr:PIN domain-containing protein [Sphingomonas sp.]
FLASVEVFPFDAAAARTYARLPFRGGSFDRLIAAHALALGLVLVTNNERDFVDVPNLLVENWTK